MKLQNNALRNSLILVILLAGTLVPRGVQAAPSSDAYEPDDSAGTASLIQHGETQDHDISPVGDVDWVTFELTTYSAIDLDIDTSVTDQMTLFLYDATGTLYMDGSSGGGGDGIPRIIRTCDEDPLEPGFYTARVDAFPGVEIAAYQVTFTSSSCQDAYEPDGDWLTAKAITNGETQDRSIFPLADQDWVQFTLEESSAIVLDIDGSHPTDEDTYMTLYQFNGSGLNYAAENDNKESGNLYSRISLGCDVALAAGSYYAQVFVNYGNAEIEAYTWSFNSMPCEDAYEQDDVWADARSIVSDVPQDRTIDPPGDQDWVTFTMPDQTGLKLWTSGPEGHDTVLSLYTDPSGSALAVSDDDGEGAYSLLQYGCSGTLLTPGTYYARVNESGDDALIPAYQLSLTLTYCADAYEPDNWFDSASIITSGVPQDHSLDPEGDFDWVTFSVDQPSAVVLETNGPDPTVYDTYLLLFDSELDYLTGNDDRSAGNHYSLITYTCMAPLAAGTYFGRVLEGGIHGAIPAYQLSLTVTPCTAVPDAYEYDDDFDNATPILSGLPQPDHSLFPAADVDVVTFTLDEPTAITLETDGPAPAVEDTYMRVLDPPMNTVAVNDNKAADDLYSRITFTCDAPLAAGTYYIQVYETGQDSIIPSYQITLTINPCNRAYLPLIIRPAAAGAAPRPVGRVEHPAGYLRMLEEFGAAGTGID